MEHLHPGRTDGKRVGFTLIEVLIVIVIIGLLAGLLFPVFAKARQRARETTCISHLRQIGQAAQMYMADHNGRLPSHNPYGRLQWRKGLPQESARWVTKGYHEEPLENYGVTRDILRCPSYGGESMQGGYKWRFRLSLTNYTDRFTERRTRGRNRRIRPQPDSVLAYCIRHLTEGYYKTSRGEGYSFGNNRKGIYLVLRENGAVQRVPAGQVKIWGYEQVKDKDKWYPIQYPHPASLRPWQQYDVFPNEPWPPKFEE